MPKRRRGQRSSSDQQRGRDAADAAAPEFFEYELGVAVPRDVTHLRVPPSVRSLPHDVFRGLKHLVEVELSEGLLEIGRKVFCECTSLVRVRLPSTLVRIELMAFYCCTSLTVLHLPEGLSKIGYSALWKCSSLRRIRIPFTVTMISHHAFHGCSTLREVILVDGIQEIDNYGFSECQSLVSLVLPASIVRVGDEAFRGCTALRTATWCGGITWIGWDTFKGCNLLDHVRAPSAALVATNTRWNRYTRFQLARDGTVPRTDRLQTVIASECFNSMSPEDVTELEHRIREVLRTEDDEDESVSVSDKEVRARSARDEQRGQLRSLLAPHEARHKEEVTTLLELALWKARLAGSNGAVPETGARGAQRRQESHVQCGAGDVIPNVLQFL